MEGMEDKLGAILNNPQMMSQIMSMAQSLGQNTEAPAPAPSQPEQKNIPDINPAALQQIMRLAGQTGIDQNQKALLGALRPYLTSQRIGKLEKAMRAAKLASLATTALNSGALTFLTGR
jgi:hypothetical protein